MTEKCPHCGTDLRDGIYSRAIGVEICGVYDGVLYWECPLCEGTWHRWQDPGMRAKAQPYIRGRRQ